MFNNWKAISKIALISWFIGLAIAPSVMMITRLFEGMDEGVTILNMVGVILLGSIVLIPGSLLFGSILTIPLFALAVLVALIFQNQIKRFPIPFALSAPVCTGIIVALWTAYTRDNNWARKHDFWEKFWFLLFDSQTALFVFPVFAASSFYCWKWVNYDR